MSAHSSEPGDTSQDMISLATLPYDLLLNIARHLELNDIYALQLVSILLRFMWRLVLCTPACVSDAPEQNRPHSRGALSHPELSSPALEDSLQLLLCLSCVNTWIAVKCRSLSFRQV